MLLLLVVGWVLLVIAICAVCAAAGVADEQSEKAHAERQEGNLFGGPKRDAA